MHFRSRIKVWLLQRRVRRPAMVCIRCTYPVMPLFSPSIACIGASCVMTLNDHECVNPESGTDTAIGRSENGLASDQIQSEVTSILVIDDVEEPLISKTGRMIKYGENKNAENGHGMI